MNKLSIKLALPFSLFAILVGSLAISLRSEAAGPGESANGQGTLIVQDENGKDVRRTFSLSAQRQKDGTVKGHAVLHNPAFTGDNEHSPYMLQIDVSCLKVVGNIAYMGGTTRKTNDPSLVDAVFFAVQDNGEPGKGKDMISRAYFWDDDPTTTGDPQACQSLPDPTGPVPDEVIEAGNIQVRQ